jgi:hypothetical protein
MMLARSVSVLSVAVGGLLALPTAHADVACSDNAALRYWMAFAEMDNPDADRETAERLQAVAESAAPWDDRLAPILDRNAEALETMRRGTRQPFCNWGYEYDRLAAAPVANVARARALSRLNVLDGRRRLRAGKSAEAVDVWLAGLRFSRDIASDGPLLSALVAGRSLRVHLAALTEAAAEKKLGAAETQRIAREVAALPEAGFDWSVAVQHEWSGSRAVLARLEHDPDPLRTMQQEYQLLAKAKPDEIASALGIGLAQVSDREAVRGALRRAGAFLKRQQPAMVAAFALPHERSLQPIREADARLSQDPTVSLLSPSVVRLYDARGEVVKARAELLALVGAP